MKPSCCEDTYTLEPGIEAYQRSAPSWDPAASRPAEEPEPDAPPRVRFSTTLPASAQLVWIGSLHLVLVNAAWWLRATPQVRLASLLALTGDDFPPPGLSLSRHALIPTPGQPLRRRYLSRAWCDTTTSSARVC
jgi:hypothetical protein